MKRLYVQISSLSGLSRTLRAFEEDLAKGYWKITTDRTQGGV